MGTKEPSGDPDFQRQLGELAAQVADNRADIKALNLRADEAQVRADEAKVRADVAESRADEADVRAGDSEARVEANHLRIGALETRADVDAEMIRALQAEGLLDRAHVSNLEEALRSSRTIGAVVGIIMADRRISETDAFAVLARASQNANRKLRLLANEIVETGDVSRLPVV